MLRCTWVGATAEHQQKLNSINRRTITLQHLASQLSTGIVQQHHHSAYLATET